MRTLPAAMTAAIASGVFEGSSRAYSRVTIQPFQLATYNVGAQVFASTLFSTATGPAYELPNLKKVGWDRSVDAPIGEARIELWNVAPLPSGVGPAADGSFDLLGYYSPSRARSGAWGQIQNRWQNLLVPDRLLRIYQGYGADFTVLPENDPHMVAMGAYLIDDVDLSADGVIKIVARDVGRLLTDDIAFPPVVPFKQYPLRFSKKVTTPGTTTTKNVATWRTPTYDTSSLVPYVGVNGTQYGHHGVDAFDADASTFWLSIGNAQPSQGYSFEYIQGKFNALTINATRCAVWGGPYRVYVSVYANGAWQGKAIVPYDPNNPASAPNGANIPYVAVGTVAHEGTIEFAFPKAYANATKIRFTFTDLYNSGLGIYPYRAGARTVQIATDNQVTTTTAAVTTGSYGDYSEIAKLLLAYGGFYWPRGAQQILSSAGPGTPTNVVSMAPATDDPYLTQGNLWANIQMSGTAGVADLGPEIFDKRPLLDGIVYVKDILGFVLYVDEQGAANFRNPNLFKVGNWLSDVNGADVQRTSSFKTIRDDQVILNLNVKMSSRDLREKVFVGNVSGKIAAISNGRIPYPSNLRRTAGWTDANFSSTSEVQVMADLITLRQLFSFRQNSFRIPADPSIQVDDQVRLMERVTAESYMHYIRSIKSDWDAATGVWTYDLTTSWLGTDPSGEWAFSSTGLSSQTQAYLKALGAI